MPSALLYGGTTRCGATIMGIQSNRARFIRRLFWAALLWWAVPAAEVPGEPDTEGRADSAVAWHNSLEDAVVLEGDRNAPMLIFFGDGNETWDVRMRDRVLVDASLSEVLDPFIRVRLDIGRHRSAADRYRVRRTPALVVVSEGGQERSRHTGFLDESGCRSFLLSALGQSGTMVGWSRLSSVLARLQKGKAEDLEADEWLEVLIGLSEKQYREHIREAVLGCKSFPLGELRKRLAHPRLAVRCAALELLEEKYGSSFGFDPWAPGTEKSLHALELWRDFEPDDEMVSADDAGAGELYASLTEEELARRVEELFAADSVRADRALRQLLRGGLGTAISLTEYRNQNPELPPRRSQRLQEVTFAAALQGARVSHPERSAHVLVVGNLDSRLKAIERLASAGKPALPVLLELLYEDDSLIREAVVDAVAKAGGRQSLQVFAEHVEQEKDVDVLVGLAQNLGRIRTRRSRQVLIELLERDDEDVLIAALQGLAKFREHVDVTESVIRCLKHASWRVRAAATECIGKLPVEQRPAEFTRRITDEDAFVRTVAMKTLKPKKTEAFREQLLDVYAKHPGNRAAVLALFAAAGEVPDTIREGLQEQPEDVINGALVALRGYGAGTDYSSFSNFGRPGRRRSTTDKWKTLRLLARVAIQSEHTPLRIAGYTAVARVAGSDSSARQLVLQGLAESNEDVRLAVLREMTPVVMPSLRLRSQEMTPADGEETSSEEVDALSDAFSFGESESGGGGESAGDETDEPEEEGADVDGLLSAFGPETAPKKTEANGEADSSAANPETASLDDLHGALKRAMREAPSRTERVLAAVQLFCMGDPEVLDTLLDFPEDIPEELGGEVCLRLLEFPHVDKAATLVKRLLRRPEAALRKAMCKALVTRMEPEPWVAVMMADMVAPNRPLRPEDAFGHWQLNRVTQEGKSSLIRPCAEYIHKHAHSNELKRLGLYFSIALSDPEWDVERIRDHLEAEDAGRRTLGWCLLAVTDFNEFARRVPELLDSRHSSDRMLIPRLILIDLRVTVLKEESGLPSNVAERIAQRIAYRRDDFLPLLDALSKRESDRASRWLALLARTMLGDQVSPDVVAMETAGLADAEATLNKLSYRTKQQLRRKSPEVHRVLFGKEEVSDWGVNSAGVRSPTSSSATLSANEFPRALRDMARRERRVRTEPQGPEENVSETRRSSTPSAGSSASTTSRPAVRIHFFIQPGCRDCREVGRYLETRVGGNPSFEVRIHDMDVPGTAVLNEALCHRLRVPDRLRLATPAVFCRVGGLVAEQATPDALDALLDEALTSPPDPGWDRLDRRKAEDSRTAIGERLSGFTLGVVAYNALIDGINPCAFAVIVFLISYLRIAGRGWRETLLVGLAYAFAVFATYLAIGVGLTAFTRTLTPHPFFGNLLTGVLALMLGALFLASLRDAYLCFRGRPMDMHLQLPSALKGRIHAVIRRGARSRFMVPAALAMGVGVSLLELTCTGQVYLPTILFVLRELPDNSTVAFSWLLIYNTVFILPLLTVFGLYLCGVGAGEFSGWMRKRAGVVKLLLAMVFLVMLIMTLR